MSHIARVGSRSPKVRTALAVLYLVLILGAVTTVYPFLLMVSTATKSQSDYTQYELVPRYLYDDRALYVKYLEDKYANNLDDLNAAHAAEYANFSAAADQFTVLRADKNGPVGLREWNELRPTLPEKYFKAGFNEHDNAPSALLMRYRDHLRQIYNNDIAALNREMQEENIGFDNVTPPFERTALRDYQPDLSKPRVLRWEAFKGTLPRHFLIPISTDAQFRNYLKQDVYASDLSALNRAWGQNFSSWKDVVLPATVHVPKALFADWSKFLQTKFPKRYFSADGSRVENIENLFRAAYYKDKPLSGLEKTNDPPTPVLPFAYLDAKFDNQDTTALRWDFATRNFRAVFGQIFLNGRAVANTVVFCLLAILAAVVVNPLCAYALSRYPLPYAYQVLLFLLATMAFPAEVAMIPNFLLLKDLGLLNTFGALVLPTLANGFAIFLLKGFFDSLPKELYEAAILDGATEITMFRRITIPLSMPIFSVIALNAFTASYGAFLFALVVCQDPKMWTLMVWLYNLQATAPQYVIMAALTLAALPTLIVFLFAQRVILRGIVLPSFK